MHSFFINNYEEFDKMFEILTFFHIYTVEMKYMK